jgi:hypothetical protein
MSCGYGDELERISDPPAVPGDGRELETGR